MISGILAGNINSFGDALLSFGIGGLSGIANGGISMWTANSFSLSGFAGGLFTGTIGGFAGGFVSGCGNAWQSGSGFINGLKMGLQNAYSNSITAGITNGVAQGIAATNEGFNFWDGSIYNEICSTKSIKSSTAIDYKNIAKGYESTAMLHDPILKDRVFDTWRVKEGSYGITNITTKAPLKYGMNKKGIYVNLKTGSLVDGVVKSFFHGKSSVHISNPITYADIHTFKAVVGHELIHAYQYYTNPFVPNISERDAEIQAYGYTYSVYFNAGMYSQAGAIYNIMKTNNFIGESVYKYTPPFITPW